MTFKILASTLAISAAAIVPAVAQDAPPAAPATGLPANVAGVSLPATNVLPVGGLLIGAVGLLAGSQDGTTSTTATTSTTSTTSTN